MHLCCLIWVEKNARLIKKIMQSNHKYSTQVCLSLDRLYQSMLPVSLRRVNEGPWPEREFCPVQFPWPVQGTQVLYPFLEGRCLSCDWSEDKGEGMTMWHFTTTVQSQRVVCSSSQNGVIFPLTLPSIPQAHKGIIFRMEVEGLWPPSTWSNVLPGQWMLDAWTYQQGPVFQKF